MMDDFCRGLQSENNEEKLQAALDAANDREAELRQEIRILKQRLQQAQADNRSWRSQALRYQTEILSFRRSRRWRLADLLVCAAHSPKKLIRLPYDLFKLYRNNEEPKVVAGHAASLPPARYNRSEIIAAAKKYLSPALESDVLVSIIICNHNGIEHLRRLFASLKENTFYRNFEIIVADNASDDESLSFLEEQKKEFSLQIICNERNESFSFANNVAAEAANGEYLLFLNNDVEVTDGWLDEMLRTALEQPQAGAVGAKLVYPQIPEGVLNSGRSFYVQHSGIAFRSAVFQGNDFVRPFNRCLQEAVAEEKEMPKQMAAVTAACLLMRKSVFEQIGGFDEHYVYGYEDVDLCLKAHRAGYKNYYCPTAVLFHYEFGTQSTSSDDEVAQRRRNNIKFFSSRWNEYLKRELLLDKLNCTCCFADAPLVVAFAVTEAHSAATAGDYFTAMELAQALQKRGYRIKYLRRTAPQDWYNVGENVDVLISMLDSYDPEKIYNAQPELITVAWARNWFERWCGRPYIGSYTLLFASSDSACRYMKEKTGRDVTLFPIATNAERFARVMEEEEDDRQRRMYESDYVFTGSNWDSKRNVTDWVQPRNLPYRFRVFGKNWEGIPAFAPYVSGFVNYDQIPYVYKYTKIVVDDANSATVRFGAVNSRVYDAIASGKLVLTTGKTGAEETFRGLLPAFESSEEFERLMRLYMQDDALRAQKVKELQELVLREHTYDNRAEFLLSVLRDRCQIRENHVAVMVPVPKWEEREQWGDYHFAVAMKKCLEQDGYTAEIRILPEWERPFNGKAVIVLRGLSIYQPKPEHINIMWNISHPDAVSDQEYNGYDAVYVASEIWAKQLKKRLRVRVEPLMQCCDPDVFAPGEEGEKHYQLLFVGNSRKVYRRIIRDLLPTEYNLSVYGTNWESLIAKEYLKGKNIPNAFLAKTYRSCDILLNDHWDDMREKGFVSNRLFDGLACGAFIVTDEVSGLEKILPDCVVTYTDRDDLKTKIDYYMQHPEARREMAERGMKLVRQQHTFRNRVQTMTAFIEEYRDKIQ
ncbi:MAG: glycosyltransferase [Clostridia bacterium]|nr:glycosyltransferase [Clostridia bacterium]